MGVPSVDALLLLPKSSLVSTLLVAAVGAGDVGDQFEVTDLDMSDESLTHRHRAEHVNAKFFEPLCVITATVVFILAQPEPCVVDQ